VKQGSAGEIEALAWQDQGMFAPDDGAWHWVDHFERYGGRDIVRFVDLSKVRS
jgi:hypothetical protein